MFNDYDVFCKYDNVFKRTCLISKVRSIYIKKKDIVSCKVFSLCGRVFGKRIMGKAAFVNLYDFSGSIQLYLSFSNLQQSYYKIVSYLSLGDIVGVKGKVFITKMGEFTLSVSFIEFLAKNFNLFPDKRKGLLDKELCYRYRYLDLMVNKKTRDVFKFRSLLIFEMRKFFFKYGYLEVETPVMQCIPGGASAKPFVTYHNYLDSNLYLRVSPELYLKRLVIGGFDKIFELSKSFRNEGLSNFHNPEFTMVEFYQAYANYKNIMLFTEKLFKYLSKKLFGFYKFIYQGIDLDFSSKFIRLSFKDALIKYNKGLCKKTINNREVLLKLLRKVKLLCSLELSLGELQFKLFEETVEKRLLKPTFILHYPKDVSPLAKSKKNDISVTERFELYIAGREIANGFSELNDPVDQSNRFRDQLKKRYGECNISYDADYIKALEYGLPPTAGEGIGIDRLVMLFTNLSSIKDVLFFPLMKDKRSML